MVLRSGGSLRGGPERRVRGDRGGRRGHAVAHPPSDAAARGLRAPALASLAVLVGTSIGADAGVMVRVVVLLAVLSVGVMPRVSIAVGGLSSADYRIRNSGRMSDSALAARLQESSGLLLGALYGVSVLVAAVGFWLALRPQAWGHNLWDGLLSASLAAALLLRSRVFSRTIYMLPLRLAALVVLLGILLQLARENDTLDTWLTAIVAGLGAVALGVSILQLSDVTRARIKSGAQRRRVHRGGRPDRRHHGRRDPVRLAAGPLDDRAPTGRDRRGGGGPDPIVRPEHRPRPGADGHRPARPRARCRAASVRPLPPSPSGGPRTPEPRRLPPSASARPRTSYPCAPTTPCRRPAPAPRGRRPHQPVAPAAPSDRGAGRPDEPPPRRGAGTVPARSTLPELARAVMFGVVTPGRSRGGGRGNVRWSPGSVPGRPTSGSWCSCPARGASGPPPSRPAWAACWRLSATTSRRWSRFGPGRRRSGGCWRASPRRARARSPGRTSR